jgi:hypothetical protein
VFESVIKYITIIISQNLRFGMSGEKSLFYHMSPYSKVSLLMTENMPEDPLVCWFLWAKLMSCESAYLWTLL